MYKNDGSFPCQRLHEHRSVYYYTVILQATSLAYFAGCYLLFAFFKYPPTYTAFPSTPNLQALYRQVRVTDEVGKVRRSADHSVSPSLIHFCQVGSEPRQATPRSVSNAAQNLGSQRRMGNLTSPRQYCTVHTSPSPSLPPFKLDRRRE